MRIYLTGFMGCGKSTIGRLLAQNTNFSFIDLDDEIERRAGKSIPEIFSNEGEQEFRRLERETLHQINADHAVIATGAGCFIHNSEWMLQNGRVVYLHVPFSELGKRIGADTSRPLWRNAEKLYQERESIYRKANDQVDASEEPSAVCERVTNLIFPAKGKIRED